MSEIKAGQQFWSRAVCERVMDDVRWPHMMGWPQDVDGMCHPPEQVIPDVPGLPQLAALIAEVGGVEKIVAAIDDADDAMRLLRGRLIDNGTADAICDSIRIDGSLDILRRLAAALELK